MGYNVLKIRMLVKDVLSSTHHIAPELALNQGSKMMYLIQQKPLILVYPGTLDWIIWEALSCVWQEI